MVRSVLGTFRFGRHLGITAAVLFGILSSSATAAAQSGAAAVITYPGSGQILQGVVEVQGTADAQDFGSATLQFTYNPAPSDSWYTIQGMDAPVVDGRLGEWDTERITDGDYLLRLLVVTADGGHYDSIVEIQVRNYTRPRAAITSVPPTETPGVRVATPMFVILSPTQIRAQPATPTRLPVNRAALTHEEMLQGLLQGALTAIGIFVLLGLLSLRRRR